MIHIYMLKWEEMEPRITRKNIMIFTRKDARAPREIISKYFAALRLGERT
jgi:hypothetical protein